jgi:type IV pilus assembly protein PilM
MTALGLHLKSNGFSAVELENHKDSPTLIKCDDRAFPALNLDLNNEATIGDYVEKLKEFLYDNNFKSSEVACSLPQPEVFVRTIKVPPMNKKDLDNFIKYESAQYIPLPLEEVTLGYEQMPVDITEPNKMSILLVAAKKRIVEKYIQIVKKTQLTPIAMEPESLAMSRSLSSERGDGVAELLVDIGDNETLIILSYKSFVILTRNLPLGARTLAKTLAQQFNLDEDQAIEYKNTYGLDATKAEGKVYEVLRPLFDKMIEEIERSRVFFTTHNPNVRVDKVIVSGETALMPGLLVYLVNHFNVEVELANPWARVSWGNLANKKDLLFQRGPLYTVAVGLALRGIKK